MKAASKISVIGGLCYNIRWHSWKSSLLIGDTAKCKHKYCGLTWVLFIYCSTWVFLNSKPKLTWLMYDYSIMFWSVPCEQRPFSALPPDATVPETPNHRYLDSAFILKVSLVCHNYGTRWLKGGHWLEDNTKSVWFTYIILYSLIFFVILQDIVKPWILWHQYCCCMPVRRRHSGFCVPCVNACYLTTTTPRWSEPS